MYAYIDECGMASIAGPGMVCAVAAEPKTSKIDGIKDSKKLSKKRREELSSILKSKLIHSCQFVPIKRIAEINLHWAKYEAMSKAVMDLVERGHKIDKVIIDGKFVIPDFDIPQEAIIRADSSVWQVGAASIIGKVARDNYMADLAKKNKKYSYYDFENNAGYYSPLHRNGIILHGPCDLHRKEFVYFKYCLDRHNEFKEFIKENDPRKFFEPELDKNGKEISDYYLWKEGKKSFWAPILPKVKDED